MARVFLTGFAGGPGRMAARLLIGCREPRRVETVDGREHVLAAHAWLAVSDHSAATVTGGYLHHRRHVAPLPATGQAGLQDALLDRCAELIGTALPTA
jgi:hypothetical protein